MHEMRRKKQALSTSEIEGILKRNTSGTLAIFGDDEYPYAVPLSYVFYEGYIYFHCAKSGHKMDAIKHHNRVSFCVIDQDEIVPEKFTTKYRSVISFGHAFIVNDDAEKESVLWEFARKYSHDFKKESHDEIAKGLPSVEIIKVIVDRVSGKQGRELLNS